ncbi:MAG: type II toxin-antitoxin system RelE/ParE family toxin [Lautropia sp.]|nr:type II toxin-antitoxin system RelE/ParE family toxin [Lautropia sp.]
MNWKKQPRARIEYTKAARKQLSFILLYVQSEFGPTVARRVKSNIDHAISTLSRFHYLGMAIEKHPPYRKLFVGGRNTVVYRVDTEAKPPRIVIAAIYVRGEDIDLAKMPTDP